LTGLVSSFALQDAIALHQRGAIPEAASRYAEVLRQEPRNLAAMFYLALASGDLGRFDDAVKLFRKVLKAAPSHVGAMIHLGSALQAKSEHEEALKTFDRVLRLAPGEIETQFRRGNTLMALGRLDEAVAAFDAVLAAQSDSVETLVNRANALRSLGRDADAEAGYQAAVALRPDIPDTHFSLGLLYENLCEHEKALACYDRALALDPFRDNSQRLALLHMHRAVAEQTIDRPEDAAKDFARAAEIAPDFDQIPYTTSFFDRARGRWLEAWPKHERRLSFRTETPRVLRDKPMWNGEPPDGSMLLIHGEEGFGDQVQFASYIPMLASMGHRVAYWPHDSFGPLARSIPGLEKVVRRDRDVAELGRLRWLHLLSLPHVFKTTPESVPQTVPYLFADPARLEAWRGRIAGPGLKVGIHWQGNPRMVQDRIRSMPLSYFKPIADIPTVRLFSLQKLPGAAQIGEVDFGERIEAPLDPKDISADALQDTAALIAALDLIVTSDSMIAHLAGAMGLPVLLAVMKIPDWRWLDDRDDSPWYPTMRIFRQPERGDWSDVFRRIAEAVRARVAA
jgi:tetratricopeptide (TPR) repeat protein